METLSIELISGSLFLNISPFVTRCEWSENIRGSATCTLELDAPRLTPLIAAHSLSLRLYIRARTVLMVWRGRVEDIEWTPGGTLRITAYGLQRRFQDSPYVALWTDDSMANWRAGTNDLSTSVRDGKFTHDTNDRIYIAPRFNATYMPGEMMYMYYQLVSTRSPVSISFSYSMILPVGWELQIVSFNVFYSLDWVLASTGALQTGTQTVAIAPNAIHVEVRLARTGAAYTHTAQDGEQYARLTNVFLRSSATYQAQDIMAALLTHVGAYITPYTPLIESTGLDLTQEIYRADLPSDILDRLALIGDAQGRRWEWGIDRYEQPYFRPKTTPQATWYLLDAAPTITVSLDRLRTRARAFYHYPQGGARLTQAASDPTLEANIGYERSVYVEVQTTSASQAERARDAALADASQALRYGEIETSVVYSAMGRPAPVYYVHAGDTIIVPGDPKTGIDTSSFRVGELRYDAISGVGKLTPEDPPRTLDTLIARRQAGIER